MSYFWETGVYALAWGTAIVALYVGPKLLREHRRQRSVQRARELFVHLARVERDESKEGKS